MLRSSVVFLYLIFIAIDDEFKYDLFIYYMKCTLYYMYLYVSIDYDFKLLVKVKLK